MDEFYKAVRFSHRLIMTVPIAFLLFAFSPDLTIRYEAARKESLALQEISYDNYIEFVSNQLQKNNPEDLPDCFDTNQLTSDRAATLKQVTGGMVDNVRRHAYLLLVPDQRLSTIQQFLGFFTKSSIVILCITPSTIADVTGTALKNSEFTSVFANGPADEIELVFATEKVSEHRTEFATVFLGTFLDFQDENFELADGVVNFIEAGNYFEQNSHYSAIAYRSKNQDSTIVELKVILENTPSLSTAFTYANQWFTDKEEIQTGEQTLPGLFAILDEVKNKSVDDTIRYLDVKIASEKTHPKVYGIEIDSSYVLMVAPLVVLVLQMFFGAHLIGLKNELLRSDTAVTFPSVLFYSGAGTSLLAPITIIILPFVATLALIFRIGNFYSWESIVSTTLAILVAIFSLGCNKLCQEVKTIANTGI